MTTQIPAPDHDVLVVDEVADILRTTRARVYALTREGRISGVIRLGRQLRFDRTALLEWLQAGGYRLPGGWRCEQVETQQHRPRT